MRWLRTQSLSLQVAAVVMLAIAVGCVALPMGLHHMALARIREANLDAIRFAAAEPDQLRLLSVTGWREGEKVVAASIRKTGWEQYQMALPHGEASTIIDVDLRSTMLPLLLGFGGWLRIFVMVVLSGSLAYLLIKRCRGWCAIIPPPSRQSASGGRGEGDQRSRQDPSQQDDFLRSTLEHIPSPALFFDAHHQLVHWNSAVQAAIPHVSLAAGIHMLDLSAHLPWGRVMVEKMDELAQHPALIIHKGESICIIPG